MKNMMKGNKKLLILGTLVMALIIALVLVKCVAKVADPNKTLKKYAIEIEEGKEYPADFKSSKQWMGEAACMVTFSFTPEESAEYTFTGKGEAVRNDVSMLMFVLDEKLSGLLSADNYGDDDEQSLTDLLEGTVFLTKGQLYYVVVEASSPEPGVLDAFEESFSFSVNKSGEGAPAELKTGESVRLQLNKDQQACAVFVPEETAFYGFDTSIVSKDASSGFSSIYDITTEDNTSMIVTDGVCSMEAGKTYYVWVGVDETTKKRSEVELSCRKMASEAAAGLCSIEINGETVIEYTAEASMPLMISSSSDGDPDVVMYDSEGFMQRKDDDSGGAVSDNPHDFALGFHAEKGKVYRICVSGEFTHAVVTVQEYKGDGSAPDSNASAEAVDDTEEAESETEQ